MQQALAARHGRLGQGETAFRLELRPADAPIRDEIARVSPQIADAIPDEVDVEIAALDTRDLEHTVAEAVRRVAGLFWLLLAVTVGAAALRAAWDRDVRRLLTDAGLAVAGAGVLVFGTLEILEGLVVEHASHAADLASGDERAAVTAVWGSLFGDLGTAGLVLAVAGAAVAAFASGGPISRWLQVAGPRLRRGLARPGGWSRPARVVALLALGVAFVAAPSQMLRVLVVLAGLGLIVVGAAELAGRTAPAPGSTTDQAATLSLVGAVGTIIAVAIAALLFVLPSPTPAPAVPPSPPDGCNGTRLLCDARLDEVVFPATHNSYAAADEPGWFFAHHRFGIERQLRDGIRGLLIDLHYGVPDPESGVVRTDLRYEGSSRNKVARQLSPEAVATADRVAGRPVGGELRGERGVYFCHTLCELGSEPVAQELGVIRRFLDANPREVLLVFVEPYVDVRDIERAFDAAGLTRFAAELDRSEPLPTLGELVASGRRLVVLAEEDGGDPAVPWYLDGFSFVQDTPYNAQRAAELSCRANRGEGDSPMFLLNHWIAAFPPSIRANAAIGGAYLERRLAGCELRRRLVANLPAVDFYEQSGVVELARRLNADPGRR